MFAAVSHSCIQCGYMTCYTGLVNNQLITSFNMGKLKTTEH